MVFRQFIIGGVVEIEENFVFCAIVKMIFISELLTRYWMMEFFILMTIQITVRRKRRLCLYCTTTLLAEQLCSVFLTILMELT